MSKLFDKKIVAITGAAGGIGQELARHFGREGAIIFAIDKKDAVNRKKEAEIKAAEKQAILDRIGLTVDELKTILG